eukprot:TRINITY_DN772_c0_g2_i3.p1 TRINITY_DN772_c0_g2~~TRINITY_DN772_c0_g2_i3.p1  ORF type:complete len:209 (+),score=45.94 TRINITY_DN772_c0_g2_i3:65-691(+)
MYMQGAPMGMGMGMGMPNPMGTSMGMGMGMGMGMPSPMMTMGPATLVTPTYGGYGMCRQPWTSYPVFPYAGYPVWATLYPGQMLPPNMYFKPIWTMKREMKLQRCYMEVVRDGVITPYEVQYVLHKFGYPVDFFIAQWVLFNLDRNRDGRISYEEFKLGVMQFVVGWPRGRNQMKPWKMHYAANYNWATNPLFMASPYVSTWNSWFHF